MCASRGGKGEALVGKSAGVNPSSKIAQGLCGAEASWMCPEALHDERGRIKAMLNTRVGGRR